MGLLATGNTSDTGACSKRRHHCDSFEELCKKLDPDNPESVQAFEGGLVDLGISREEIQSLRKACVALSRIKLGRAVSEDERTACFDLFCRIDSGARANAVSIDPSSGLLVFEVTLDGVRATVPLVQECFGGGAEAVTSKEAVDILSDSGKTILRGMENGVGSRSRNVVSANLAFLDLALKGSVSSKQQTEIETVSKVLRQRLEVIKNERIADVGGAALSGAKLRRASVGGGSAKGSLSNRSIDRTGGDSLSKAYEYLKEITGNDGVVKELERFSGGDRIALDCLALVIHALSRDAGNARELYRIGQAFAWFVKSNAAREGGSKCVEGNEAYRDICKSVKELTLDPRNNGLFQLFDPSVTRIAMHSDFDTNFVVLFGLGRGKQLRCHHEERSITEKDLKLGSRRSVVGDNGAKVGDCQGERYSKVNDKVFDGNCGLNAIWTAANCVYDATSARNELIEVNDAIAEFNEVRLKADYSIDKGQALLKKIFGGNFSHFENYVKWRNSESKKPQDVGSDEKARLDDELAILELAERAFERVNSDIIQKIEFDIELSAKYKEENAWLTDGDVKAGMLRKGFVCIRYLPGLVRGASDKTAAAQTVLCFENLTTEERAYIACNQDMKTVSPNKFQGSHWVCVVPEAKQEPVNRRRSV